LKNAFLNQLEIPDRTELQKSCLNFLKRDCSSSIELLDHILGHWTQYTSEWSSEYRELNIKLRSLANTLASIGFTVAPSTIKFPFLDIEKKEYHTKKVDIVKIQKKEITEDFMKRVYADMKNEQFLGYQTRQLQDNSWEVIFVFKEGSTITSYYQGQDDSSIL